MNATPLALACVLAAATQLAAQGLDGEPLKRALKDRAASFWIYDDLDAATELAERSGKPLLVSFRCVP